MTEVAEPIASLNDIPERIVRHAVAWRRSHFGRIVSLALSPNYAIARYADGTVAEVTRAKQVATWGSGTRITRPDGAVWCFPR